MSVHYSGPDSQRQVNQGQKADDDHQTPQAAVAAPHFGKLVLDVDVAFHAASVAQEWR